MQECLVPECNAFHCKSAFRGAAGFEVPLGELVKGGADLSSRALLYTTSKTIK
jgi:hypothetical protein